MKCVRLNLISILLFAGIFCVFSPLAYAEMSTLHTNKMDYTYEKDATATFDTHDGSARHYGCGWRKYKNVFKPLPNDLMYFDCRWISSSFDRAFFLWTSNEQKFLVSQDTIVIDNGMLYGLRIHSETQSGNLSSAETVMYLEIHKWLSIDEARRIASLFPKTTILNFCFRNSSEVVSVLSKLLSLSYINWGFVDRHFPILTTHEEVQNILDSIHHKYSEYFDEVYASFPDEYCPSYVSIETSSKIVNMWASEKSINFLGVVTRTFLDNHDVAGILDNAPNLRGFVSLFVKNDTREALKFLKNRNVRYFAGSFSRLGGVAWKHLVFCSSNYTGAFSIGVRNSSSVKFLIIDKPSRLDFTKMFQHVQKIECVVFGDRRVIWAPPEELTYLSSSVTIIDKSKAKSTWFTTRLRSLITGDLWFTSQLDEEQIFTLADLKRTKIEFLMLETWPGSLTDLLDVITPNVGFRALYLPVSSVKPEFLGKYIAKDGYCIVNNLSKYSDPIPARFRVIKCRINRAFPLAIYLNREGAIDFFERMISHRPVGGKPKH